MILSELRSTKITYSQIEPPKLLQLNLLSHAYISGHSRIHRLFLLRHPYIAIGLGLFGVWENFNDVELDCEFEGELEQDRARCARRRRRRRGRARDLCLTQWSPRFSRLLSEEFPQFRAFEVRLAAPSAEWDRFRV